MKRFVSACLLMSGLLVVFAAEANLIGVDFGSNPNPTPQNWTASNGSSSLTNLQDDTGTPTTAGLSFSSNPILTPGCIAQPNSNTIPSYSYSLGNIGCSIYSIPSGTLTMTITGLTPGTSYSIYVFGLRTAFNGPNQTITLTGQNTETFTQAAGNSQLAVNDQVGSSSSSLNSYAKLITADSNGSIVITVIGSSGYYIAGLAIGLPSAVPSLSEWTQLLLALMTITLVGWHFHRERSH